MSVPDDSDIAVRCDRDVVEARRRGRELAQAMGFSLGDATLIATAVSEVARNIVAYTSGGTVSLRRMNGASRVGLQIIAADDGPGIRDVEQAMRDGYSCSGGLGLGLPGVRRLMDEFVIESAVGKGTTVRVIKWLQAG